MTDGVSADTDFAALFVDVCMYVAPYFNRTFGFRPTFREPSARAFSVRGINMFRFGFLWMCVCVSLHISIGLLVALRRFAFFAVAILGCMYVCRSIFQ